MPTKIQIRRGTASQWTTANPTLSAGEFGLETDTDKVKLGDGETVWTSLAYFGNLEALDNVGDVVLTGEAAGEFLKYDGANWINDNIAIDNVTNLTTELSGKADSSHTHGMSDLTAFEITDVATGQVLQYNGTDWVNADIDALPDQSGNSGKYLTTDGTTASWESVATDPNPQIFMMMGA